MRHVYHKSDARTLWDMYQNQLDALEAAVRAMLADLGSDED